MFGGFKQSGVVNTGRAVLTPCTGAEVRLWSCIVTDGRRQTSWKYRQREAAQPRGSAWQARPRLGPARAALLLARLAMAQTAWAGDPGRRVTGYVAGGHQHRRRHLAGLRFGLYSAGKRIDGATASTR